MEAENNKGSISIIIQDDQKREIRLEMSREHESWIDQLKHGREPARKYRPIKTSYGVSIYRVPESIKKAKPQAYEPLVVFLGPFHHKRDREMTLMDEFKLRAVDRALERIPHMTREGLVEEVKKKEKKIRDCYEESAIECDGDTLAWIMTVDACFILAFLRMDLPDSSLVFCRERLDNVKRREIMIDILKMENQIPIFILKRILGLELKDPVAFLAESLSECVGGYFQGFPFKGRDSTTKDNNIELDSTRKDNNIELIKTQIKEGAFHLLDLSRRVIAQVLSNPAHNGGAPPTERRCWHRNVEDVELLDTSMIPSAKKLQQSGIKLERDKEGRVHFEPRFFQSSNLFLPRIRIYDNTEIFLRNLIALEECQRKKGSQAKRAISRHVRIMNHLIDSREDVGLSREAKIIKNLLGSDKEVAIMFNALCVEITDDDEFNDILKDVNRHYISKVDVWMSEFRKQHCSSPWYVISMVAAVILLVLTLLQTIYTMEGYFAS